MLCLKNNYRRAAAAPAGAAPAALPKCEGASNYYDFFLKIRKKLLDVGRNLVTLPLYRDKINPILLKVYQLGARDFQCDSFYKSLKESVTLPGVQTMLLDRSAEEIENKAISLIVEIISAYQPPARRSESSEIHEEEKRTNHNVVLKSLPPSADVASAASIQK